MRVQTRGTHYLRTHYLGTHYLGTHCCMQCLIAISPLTQAVRRRSTWPCWPTKGVLASRQAFLFTETSISSAPDGAVAAEGAHAGVAAATGSRTMVRLLAAASGTAVSTTYVMCGYVGTVALMFRLVMVTMSCGPHESVYDNS